MFPISMLGFVPHPNLRAALHAQTFLDMSCQPFIDFRMPRNGLLRAIRWIPVNIVPTSMPQEKTSPALQVFDEFAPFHTAISFI
uniref:Uncharacterized protein n=1 Tax=Candidatus Kentrum sp. LPFa TaxID=2126335 RepID=A0A450W0B1_9GAMM|nr:MAG: hypothetical protein BECKLPF1236A_GA0070988_100395 [Candidatus Kentron sp. LPFa]VFK26830.1 MAG: hypothetical protein BECKLPF1236C_GA0070990_100395 [Candidatus Kentron sp. LPFa]